MGASSRVFITLWGQKEAAPGKMKRTGGGRGCQYWTDVRTIGVTASETTVEKLEQFPGSSAVSQRNRTEALGAGLI